MSFSKPPKSSEKDRHQALHQELRLRMSQPQRHRLLQGYPMAPLMPKVSEGYQALDYARLDSKRPLLIGVLPHTFCNPKVKGCGFCTFPHEKFAQEPMQRVVASVVEEIKHTAAQAPSLKKRRVDALYFGGGTANLTPPEQLEELLTTLSSSFDLSQSELSLEGVPKYFLLRDEALLDVLTRAKVRHRRISMGVQTFSPEWLKKMGRDAFGDRHDLQALIEAAHKRDFTVSADLLFNLPGWEVEQSLKDVQAAIELGFDQICLYNLVLTEALDTEWAKDPSLVKSMPNPNKACASWLILRERLLEQGYTQTTLTNFEKTELAKTPKKFLYEPASFDPARYDALGFGPGAISTFSSRSPLVAAKWTNNGLSEPYLRSIQAHKTAVQTFFSYFSIDLRLLSLTRNLARLFIDCNEYRDFFGSYPFEDFLTHFTVLEEARLVRRERERIELTPEGMFYADSIAGLLAHERVAHLRVMLKAREARRLDPNRATTHHMG